MHLSDTVLANFLSSFRCASEAFSTDNETLPVETGFDPRFPTLICISIANAVDQRDYSRSTNAVLSFLRLSGICKCSLNVRSSRFLLISRKQLTKASKWAHQFEQPFSSLFPKAYSVEISLIGEILRHWTKHNPSATPFAVDKDFPYAIKSRVMIIAVAFVSRENY